MPESPTQRLAYIDWLRGLACVLMFQTHCYDSWLGGAARNTSFIGWSQLLGTLPAPLFLFLAGVSVALVTDRLRRKGVPANQIARSTIIRGAEIFGLALLFRVQEFVLGFRSAPWTDLLRVDVLNAIGISIVFMGIVCRFAKTRAANVDARRCCARRRLRSPLRRCGPLGARVGCRGFSSPISTACTSTTCRSRGSSRFFRGLRLLSRGSRLDFCCSAIGLCKTQRPRLAIAWRRRIGSFELSMRLDALPVHLYAVYDYWHTSPEFLSGARGDPADDCIRRVCLVSLGPNRWMGKWGFSPLIQLGQTSLLVYWVHIEFVYGSLSISAQARADDSDGIGGPADYFCLDGPAFDRPNPLQEARRRASESRRRSAHGFVSGRRSGGRSCLRTTARLAAAAQQFSVRFQEIVLRFLRRNCGLRRRICCVIRFRRNLENIFAGAGQTHFFPRDSLDCGRVGLERLHAVLHLDGSASLS